MEEKFRKTLIVLASIIAVFLLFSLSPVNKEPELEGRFVVDQNPSGISQERLNNDILLSSSTGSIRGEIDLAEWNSVEIARAIAKYNTRLDPTPYPYRYNEDCTFYSLYGDLFGKDPFCNLWHLPESQEWNDGHLRIEHFDYDTKNPANERYKDYVNDLLKETQLDSGLVCFTQKECNDIRVIVCTKDSHNYFSWYEGHVLMTSVDDGRRNLNAFTRFYCSSELQPLTGGIIADLVDDDYIISSFINFFKKT